MCDDVRQPADRFIPVRYRELADALARRFFADPEKREEFARIGRLIEAAVETETNAFERLIAEEYADFNPDRETVSRTRAPDPEARRRQYARLKRWIIYCFNKANFDLIDEAEFRRALDVANTHGLRIRLDESRVEDLLLFCRGRATTPVSRRNWRHPIRGVVGDVPIYRRLATAVKLADEPVVQLKLFKDIPQNDLEALMPHADVEMTMLDRLKLGATGATALGSAAIKLAPLLSLSWKLAVGKAVWAMLVGGVGLFLRTFFGYRNLRELRAGTMLKHLYFQNLDNNAGVVHRLLNLIAQEEAKEALLGYAFFLPNDGPRAEDAEQLKQLAERYLADEFGVNVAFEIDDAIETVTRLGLWADADRSRVVGLAEAHEAFAKYMAKPDSTNYHQRMADAMQIQAGLVATQPLSNS